MKRILAVLLTAMGVAMASPSPLAGEAPRVRLSTNVGVIVIRLFPERAPLSVQNFLAYVQDGYTTVPTFIESSTDS